jgi:branched-chain amino acid transport system substrate-binding protein
VDKYLKIAGKKHNVDFVQTDWVTLGTREFSGFVTKAAAAKPDVIFLILFGHEFLTMVRELHNFGLAPKVPIIQASGEGSDELVQLDAKNRENLWQGTQAYYAVGNPVARRFAETYEKRFHLPPGYRAITAYGMTRLVLRGIERANSAEPADVVRALEGWETEDWPGKVSILPRTHQTVRDFFVLRCKKPEQMKHAHDYAEVIAVGSTPLMPDELSECKDIGAL